tara:strand:- start:278 stop:1021 length:744 start_codon:yes stop_codon:yes gene_type:complete
MRIIKISIILFLLTSCADYNVNKIKKDKIFFNSKGFALIYEDTYFKDGIVNKKMNNSENSVMHSSLKKNTNIAILNPLNNKEIVAKINKNSDYPKIFNLVITKNIADELDLDLKNPYIEIREIKKNKTFIAKEGTMFEEEKKVVEKAPVDQISVELLSGKEKTENKNKISIEKNFILVISDFYYLSSANQLKDKLLKETQNNNFYIEKIKDNKYRLSVGPFKNFNSLKSIYISLNDLGFDDLNIYRK